MNILEFETLIPTAEQAEHVLTIIAPLIKDEELPLGPDGKPVSPPANGNNVNPEEFGEEQGIVAR